MINPTLYIIAIIKTSEVMIFSISMSTLVWDSAGKRLFYYKVTFGKKLAIFCHEYKYKKPHKCQLYAHTFKMKLNNMTDK